MIDLDSLFSPVCGQNHCWAPGGAALPFCQRCTGLYVGGAVALLLWTLFRPRPTPLVLWIHGLLLALMIPFGYHLLPQNAPVRTCTGQLFALGLVYYLTLVPAARLGLRERTAHSNPAAYAGGFVASLIGVQLAVRGGGPAAGAVLAWIGLAGLAAYALLAAITLTFLPGALLRALRRTPAAGTPPEMPRSVR